MIRLITDARIPDPARRVTVVADIVLENGKITDVIQGGSQNKLRCGEDEIYNAAGRYVAPALVDMHTHLREPGYTDKETVATATAAAVAGGYGYVTAMPNTMPVTDCPEALERLMSIVQRDAVCRVLPVSAITKGSLGAETVDFAAMLAAGAVAFSDDGKPVADEAVMYRAMKELARLDGLLISHAEAPSLTGNGVVAEGQVSRRLKVPGIPAVSETAAVARDLALAEATGCRLHIAHVSTAGSVALIREAKKRGARVTAETCPHYFTMTDRDVLFYGVNAKMKPPLGALADMEAVIAGLADGTIDSIATDHAPHTKADKGTLADGAFGIIGLQTAFSLAYTYLVLTGRLDSYRLFELMVVNPAKILGLSYGAVEPGMPADLTVIDTDDEFTLTYDDIRSKSKNTPFLDMPLYGPVNATMTDGQWRYNVDGDPEP